jgi:hypothetical protein
MLLRIILPLVWIRIKSNTFKICSRNKWKYSIFRSITILVNSLNNISVGAKLDRGQSTSKSTKLLNKMLLKYSKPLNFHSYAFGQYCARSPTCQRLCLQPSSLGARRPLPRAQAATWAWAGKTAHEHPPPGLKLAREVPAASSRRSWSDGWPRFPREQKGRRRLPLSKP